MAIDTAEKRRSVGGAFLAAVILPSVTNNASEDQEWRQQVGWTYSGILVSGGGVTMPLFYHHHAEHWRKG